MSANSLTERNDEKGVQAREETRASETYIRPAVNIIETDEGLTISAELPGAGKDSLDVNVEKGILTISAAVSRNVQGSPAYTEFVLANYYRQFTIPESLDHEKGKAEYANGILTLKIPRAEVAKPRKITVSTG